MTEEIITVGLAERSYPIRIGSQNLAQLGFWCREAALGKQAALVTNPTIAALYLPQVRDSLVAAGFSVTVIEIPDGEQFKSAATLMTVYDRLIDAGLDRGAFIVALGGGVVGDIAGYAAATYLRGIPFVQVPTTLLAQVDSSVGGKTGINHPKGKNLIGAFYQPRLVVVDTSTLDTLPAREYACGLAEAVKYGIVLDADLFAFMEANAAGVLAKDKTCLQRVISTSCRTKASVVEKDEREGGVRAVLNYGHTLGHAVEALTGYRQFLHGEAVAIGMAQAARLSEARGLATTLDTERILQLLQDLNLPTQLPEFSRTAYAQALSHDKKKRDEGVNFVFNKGIGNFSINLVTDLKGLLQQCGVGE
jgi:3-dehydroquinate synthase